MGVWSRFEALIFGAAVGRAGSDAVTPVLEPVRQKAWRKNRLRVLDVGTLASMRAKGMVTPAVAAEEAGASGFNADRLEALAADRQSYPGISELDAMSNRKVIDPKLIDKALSRHGIPAEYHGPVKALFSALLSPGELAAAIHRGLIPDPGLLKGEQPSGPRNVESYPVYPIPTLDEAAGHGIDRDRLGVLVGLQGLPMGVIEAAHAYYRGIITHGDYIAAFNESNNRNEWAEAVLEYARQIPTARDFMENALRGHHDFEWAAKQAARFGMSEEDAFIIYQNQGRPLNLHQITQALAWGAKYNPGEGDNPDPWMQAVLLGAVRPEYYEMQDALKYNLPSAMYFRVLQTAGVLSQAEAETWYLRLGWPPELAEQVSKAFARQTGGAAKEATAADELVLWTGGRITRDELIARLVALGYSEDDANRKADVTSARIATSALTTAVSDLHGAYKKGEVTDAEATDALGKLGLPEWAVAPVVARWLVARDAGGVALTTDGIKTAYKAGTLNRADAIIMLERLGLNANEAGAFLDSP